MSQPQPTTDLPVLVQFAVSLDTIVEPEIPDEDMGDGITLPGRPAVTLGDRVVRELGRQLLADARQEIRGTHLFNTVAGSIRDEIQLQVQAALAAFIATGEVAGRTVPQLIEAEIKHWTNRPADRWKHQKGDSLQDLIKQEVANTMAREVGTEVARAKAEALTAIRKIADEALAKALGELVEHS